MELSVLIIILKQGKKINCLSWIIFLITLITMLFLSATNFAIITIISAFILALVQTYYALRISLDYDFFILLQKNSTNNETLVEFDNALRKCQLIKNNETRTLDHRILGTLKLIKNQLIYLALQSTFFLISLSLLLFI